MSEQSLPTTGRAWHLLSRPEGWPVPGDFELREVPVPAPASGELLVANQYLSVDPYMRGRMSAAKSYAAPYELGKPMLGGAVGRVVASEAEGFAPGDHVLHFHGWREYAVLDAKTAVKVDPEVAPLSTYLGVLGMPGLTAYAGLLRVGEFREGDVVFVSGAAGAVGSEVGQIAKLKGASRVIGSAGSDDKVKLLLDEYGFDAAFNYKNGPVAEQLAKAAPDGIDLYFDNVGGEILDICLGQLAMRGRVVLCGAISQYNATQRPAGPANVVNLIPRRGRMEGFIILDYMERFAGAQLELAGWLAEGKIVHAEHVVEGLERAPEALNMLFTGDNIGKVVVKL